MEEALTYVAQAASTPTDPSLVKLFDGTAKALHHQIDLQGQRKSQYQAYLETMQVEQGSLDKLKEADELTRAELARSFRQIRLGQNAVDVEDGCARATGQVTQSETKHKFLKRLLQAFSLNQPGDAPSKAGGFFSSMGGYTAFEGVSYQAQLDPLQLPSPHQPVLYEVVRTSNLPLQPDKPGFENFSASQPDLLCLEIGEISQIDPMPKSTRDLDGENPSP